MSAREGVLPVPPMQARRRFMTTALIAGGMSLLLPARALATNAPLELPYEKWREYDAEDTVRFDTLRLRDASLIKSSPQRIIANGSDWRFLDEIKRELKA